MKPKTSSNDTSTWPLQYGNSPPSTEPESETVPQHQNVAELDQKKNSTEVLFYLIVGSPCGAIISANWKRQVTIWWFLYRGTPLLFWFLLKSPLKLWVSFRKCLVIFLYIFNHCHCQYHENYEQCNTNISWGVRNFD